MATLPASEENHSMDDQSKPPFLRRVRIRGYKSIAFCDVTLEPLTILVGRNASGKSNFLDALAFLRDTLDKGLDFALQEHGGTSVFSQVTNTNKLSFEVESDFPSNEIVCRAVYRMELALTARKEFKVDQEFLQLGDPTHEKCCDFTAAQGQVTWQGLEAVREGQHGRVSPESWMAKRESPTYRSHVDPYQSNRLLLGVIGSQPFIDLAQGIRSISCFNFQPNSMRELQQSIGSPALERDGRNLARAIEGLKELDKNALSRVQAYLTTVVPEIDGFEVIQLADYETVRFRLRSPAGTKPLELNALSMSDGTLRTLAALIAAFQKVLPHGYPSLVAIEEPETALHPAAMRVLVDALDEATLRTQILLTTHSADMLDNPTIRPENIRVVQLIDGQTVIAPVDEASVDIVRRKLNTLGGLERENQLEPNLNDLERQHSLDQCQEKSPA